MESNQDMNQRVISYTEMATQLKTLVGDEFGVVILQEIAKDIRCEKLNGNHKSGNGSQFRKNGNDDEPATPKQIEYLRQLGANFNERITKKEASSLIEDAKAIHNAFSEIPPRAR